MHFRFLLHPPTFSPLSHTCRLTVSCTIAHNINRIPFSWIKFTELVPLKAETFFRNSRMKTIVPSPRISFFAPFFAFPFPSRVQLVFYSGTATLASVTHEFSSEIYSALIIRGNALALNNAAGLIRWCTSFLKFRWKTVAPPLSSLSFSVGKNKRSCI